MGDTPVTHRMLTGDGPGRRRCRWAAAPAKPGAAAPPAAGAWQRVLPSLRARALEGGLPPEAQCRFRRRGQFQSQGGDEAFPCLETFWRNDDWHQLFLRTWLNPARN